MSTQHTQECLFPKKHSRIVRVAVPLAVPKQLDYALSTNLQHLEGRLVEVEVGSKKYHGVVVEEVEVSKYKKLKEAFLLEDAPPLSEKTLQFYKWVAGYTFSPLGEALRSALVAGKVPEQVLPEEVIIPSGITLEKETPARLRVLEVLKGGAEFSSISALAKEAGVSTGVVSGLLENGVLTKKEGVEKEEEVEINLPELSAEQQGAAGEMAAALHRGTFEPMLLDGATGSGKTEVYFDTIARFLEQEEEGQFLILLPEIALTPQWRSRFKERFGFTADVWHSGIASTVRRKTWWRVAQGKARVVVGARSALFLPFTDLKYVIVDEEHDGSYKQEEGFRYHGRDMAVALAHLWNCPIVLASATPSLETWHNVQNGRYKHLHLLSRHGGAVMPKVSMVDMRKFAPKEKDKWLSLMLVRAIGERLERGEQSLIFLNRRGLAPLLLCTGCGHKFMCPSCDVGMVVHRHRLICHHCGFREHYPESCPECHAEDKLKPYGPGTRKIAAEILEHYPEARLAIADSDAISTPKQMGELVRKMEKGEADVLVGTQMVAKGHHFKNLTFVGVVDADMGLTREDPRAAERTFQVLTQVSGRAGREEKAGEVLLQSFQPYHPLFEALMGGDRDVFLARELSDRKEFDDPPYSRQVALILSGTHKEEVLGAARKLALNFPENEELQLLGPCEAPIFRLKNKFRYRMLMKGHGALQKALSAWLSSVEIPARVRLDVDVDPHSFF